MTFRRQASEGVAFSPDLIAGIGSATPAPSSSLLLPGGLTPTAFRLSPAFLQALTASLQASIVSDHRMWTWDATYRTRRISNAVCLPRGGTARPWTPDGPCPADRRDCDWSTYVLDVACGPRSFNEQMFQYPRYMWGQAKLRTLLSAAPGAYPTKAAARAWAEWMLEVMAVSSAMLWATNIRDTTPGNLGGGASDATPLLEWKGPSVARWEAQIQSARARYGEHGARQPVMPLRMRNWNTVVNRSGWSTDSLDQRKSTLAPAAVPLSRADFLPDVGGWPVAWKAERWEQVPADRVTFLQKLIEKTPERELLAQVTYSEARSGAAYYGTYVGGEGMYLYCRAVAEDLINKPFAQIVSTGLSRWRAAVNRLPYDYRRGLYGGLEDSAAFGNMMVEAKADEVFAGAQTALGTVGGILANIPVAQIGAVIIAVVQAVLAALNEIFKATDSYATGAGAIPPCPPLPIIRVIEGGRECRWDIDPETETVPGGGTFPGVHLRLDLPRLDIDEEKSSGGGAVLVAGGILAAFLALRGLGK